MLRDLKITLVMKMENAFVTLTLLETSVINVMLDLLNSQLVTSVLQSILEKIAKVDTNLFRKHSVPSFRCEIGALQESLLIF